MMSGDEPYAGYNGIAVLLLLLAGVIATPWLLVYGIRLLIRARTDRTRAAVLRTAAALAWAAAVGMYTWGMERVLFLDDQAQARACRVATGSDHVAGYDPSFIPLRFGCLVGNGHTVDAAVFPPFLNLTVGVLVLGAVVLTILTIAERKEELT